MSSTYEGPNAGRISYSILDPSSTIARIVGATLILAAVVAVVAATRGASLDHGIPNVSEACKSAECISPTQIVTAGDARALKLRLGKHALVVDVGMDDVAAVGTDLKAPFVESEGPPGPRFHTDSADKVDAALRAAGMGHNEPVILLAPKLRHAVLAALLLQERGYTGVLIVRD